MLDPRDDRHDVRVHRGNDPSADAKLWQSSQSTVPVPRAFTSAGTFASESRSDHRRRFTLKPAPTRAKPRGRPRDPRRAIARTRGVGPESSPGRLRCGRHASAPSGRVPTTATAGESERKPAAAVERLLIVLRVAERTPPPPGRPSGHARPVRGRRTADAARHAIGLLDIGARRRRHGRPQLAAGAPSSSARRPDRLAFYMGYRPHRREGEVTRAPLPVDRDTWLVNLATCHRGLAERLAGLARVR